VVSKPRITPEGKAQADSKAQSACGGWAFTRATQRRITDWGAVSQQSAVTWYGVAHRVHRIWFCGACDSDSRGGIWSQIL